MTKAFSGRRIPKIATVASIALAFVLSGMTASSAACGGYCEARQVRAICHYALTTQDLEAHELDAEFEKCKSDPLSYLAQPVRRGEEVGLE